MPKAIKGFGFFPQTVIWSRLNLFKTTDLDQVVVAAHVFNPRQRQVDNLVSLRPAWSTENSKTTDYEKSFEEPLIDSEEFYSVLVSKAHQGQWLCKQAFMAVCGAEVWDLETQAWERSH